MKAEVLSIYFLLSEVSGSVSSEIQIWISVIWLEVDFLFSVHMAKEHVK